MLSGSTLGQSATAQLTAGDFCRVCLNARKAALLEFQTFTGAKWVCKFLKGVLGHFDKLQWLLRQC